MNKLRTRYADAVARVLEEVPDADPRRIAGFQTKAQHDGSAHVEEIERGLLCYVVTERGEELQRRYTMDPEELLYWLVDDAVSDIAGEWELRHRIDGQDSRRLSFAKRVELLAILSQHWAARKQRELDEILRRFPYSDRR